MLEVYYNSGQYEVTMKTMDPLFESAFFLFQEMGEFYERKGYFGMSHSRLRRAEIFLEFMQEKFPGQEEILTLIEESLTFDLYYRENCKSRPSWAPDPADFNERRENIAKKAKAPSWRPFH